MFLLKLSAHSCDLISSVGSDASMYRDLDWQIFLDLTALNVMGCSLQRMWADTCLIDCSGFFLSGLVKDCMEMSLKIIVKGLS